MKCAYCGIEILVSCVRICVVRRSPANRNEHLPCSGFIDPRCEWTTPDGRRCQRELGHSAKKPHHADGIEGKTCTCMLRWHPNRCEAHPENNG